jgi:hypothetical protein
MGMGNETDSPGTAGAGATERTAALAILLQRQNLLHIQQSLPAQRARLGARAYAAWVAAEFPGLPDPLTLTPEEFLQLLCRDTPMLADLLTDPAALAELARLAYGL